MNSSYSDKSIQFLPQPKLATSGYYIYDAYLAPETGQSQDRLTPMFLQFLFWKIAILPYMEGLRKKYHRLLEIYISNK